MDLYLVSGDKAENKESLVTAVGANIIISLEEDYSRDERLYSEKHWPFFASLGELKDQPTVGRVGRVGRVGGSKTCLSSNCRMMVTVDKDKRIIIHLQSILQSCAYVIVDLVQPCRLCFTARVNLRSSDDRHHVYRLLPSLITTSILIFIYSITSPIH